MHINDVNCAGPATVRRLGRAALAAAFVVLLASGCASQPIGERPASDVRIDANAVKPSQVSRREAYEYHVLAGEMAIQRNKRALAARGACRHRP